MPRFRDRAEAGRELGERLAEKYAGRQDMLVLALPRGGVVVGREVADRLDAPLDVLVVRKLGFPGQSELAMGAIASGGVRVLNEALLDQTGVSEATRRRRSGAGARSSSNVAKCFTAAIARRLTSSARRSSSSTTVSPPARRCSPRCRRCGRYTPARIVVAVPTAPRQTCEALEDVADEVVCLRQPDPFYAVGLSYEDFAEVTDDEVRALLA